MEQNKTTMEPEKITIMFNLLCNDSGRKYTATYGPGHKACLDYAGHKITVNHLLFNVLNDNKFPIATKIVLKEDLPMGYPSKAASIKILDLKRVSYYLLNINDFVHEKSNSLVADQEYLLNVVIDKDDKVSYTLTEKIVK
jgi:hypothetical protein